MSVNILSLTSVPFRPTTVQVPNLALIWHETNNSVVNKDAKKEVLKKSILGTRLTFNAASFFDVSRNYFVITPEELVVSCTKSAKKSAFKLITKRSLYPGKNALLIEYIKYSALWTTNKQFSSWFVLMNKPLGFLFLIIICFAFWWVFPGEPAHCIVMQRFGKGGRWRIANKLPHCTEPVSKIRIFPEKELRATVPISTFMCLWAIYIYSHDRSAYSAAGNMWTDPGNIKIAHRHMNVWKNLQCMMFLSTNKKFVLCFVCANSAFLLFQSALRKYVDIFVQKILSSQKLLFLIPILWEIHHKTWRGGEFGVFKYFTCHSLNW